MVRRQASGHSPGNFWNYINVLCKGGKKLLWGRKKILEMNELSWRLVISAHSMLVQSMAKLKLNAQPPLTLSHSPPSPGEGVLKKSAEQVEKPRLATDMITCSLTINTANI